MHAKLVDAIRAIRSDNGSEFKNSRFDAFCRDLGLEHQYSTLSGTALGVPLNKRGNPHLKPTTSQS
jgi:hypothetical protein